MKSIRSKLLLQIGGLILFIIVLLLLANNFLLKVYFVNQQKDTVQEYFTYINEIDNGDYFREFQLFNQLETTENVDVIIQSPDESIIYRSKNVNTAPGEEPNLPALVVEKEEIINDSYKFVYASDPRLNNDVLILEGTLDNGNLLQLSIPIDTLENSISIFNEFLLYIGIISFVLSLLLAYVLSNYFTNPIRKINDIAKKMKNLEFNHTIDINSKDELGELAKTIQELSSELEGTINNLHTQNIVLEKEMNENIKLSQKRRELLNNVSHELKTPLSLMQGYAEGLKLNVTTSKEKTNFYCDVIIGETVKMNQLVEDLLELDQSQFGDRPAEMTTTDLSFYLHSIINKYEKPIQDNDITLKLNIAKAIRYEFNTKTTERVLTNFITNAINYCNQEKQIEISLLQKDEKFIVEVFNTSAALSEKALSKIWDSFYKVDESRNRDKGGHGLGLSIVKALQEKQEKEYGVRNEKNGIVFWYEV